MKSKILKTLSIVQIFMLMISICSFVAPIEVGAAGLGVNVSESYAGSAYYQRACEAYSNNADPRIRMVQVALSQQGYKGGTGSGQWAGNGGGGRFTEYGRFMGKDNLDWCASFVSWCAAAAGIPKSVIPRSASAGYWRNAGTGTYTPIWSNGYTTYNPYKPQVGDFCLYMPYCTSCGMHYNSTSPTAHVVIVASVNNTQNSDGSWTFTTIERGNGNTVESHKISTKQSRGTKYTCQCGKQTPAGTASHVVQGFWRPNWSLVGASSGDAPGVVIKPNVTVTAPTQAEYTSKAFVNETNACVVTQITKPAGSYVTQCGVVLMDSNGNVLKNHVEDVSKIVGKNTTLFHSWYDINTEVGYTLKKGTTYKYRFFTVVDGTRFEGETRSFKTNGEAYYNVNFNANGGKCSSTHKQVVSGGTYGSLPEATRDGYIFTGWYTAPNGGSQITSQTKFTQESDVTIYAGWSRTEKTGCTIAYDANGGTGKMSSGTYEYGMIMAAPECRFKNNGKEFHAWIIMRKSDNKYLTTNNGWQTESDCKANNYTLRTFSGNNQFYIESSWASDPYGDETFCFIAVWKDAKAEEPEEELEEELEEDIDELVVKLYIDNPKMNVNGKSVNIDSQKTAPCIINGRTMIPIRALIEAMGGTVGWNQSLQQITLDLKGKTLYLRVGENYAFDRSETFELDSPPVIKNGRTLLPVRAVAEYFGATISWNSSSKCVTVKIKK